MAIHENPITTEGRDDANGEGSSAEAGTRQPGVRELAPYAPPRLEPLGAWVLTLQQTSPPII